MSTVQGIVKNAVRKTVKRPVKVPSPMPPDHGKYIYIYNNILNNRVVYSLTRTLNNKRSIKQLTFVGKKSVPAALRKDVWAPMATVTFTDPHIGANTYRMLLEFRRLHETAYPKSLLEIPRKERIRKLMDQKANSVADLAASLDMEVERITKIANETRKPQKGERVPLKLPIPVEGDVVVRWSNIYDAEFAKAWPVMVVHENMERDGRHTALPPGGGGREKKVQKGVRSKNAREGVVKEAIKGGSSDVKSESNAVPQ